MSSTPSGSTRLKNVQLSFAPSATLTTRNSERWLSIASTSAATIVLSVVLFDSGIRAMRTVSSRCPSPSTSETVAHPASRYLPPAFIGAITPSSETTTERASVGHLHRRLAHLRLALRALCLPSAPRAPWAIGPAELFDGCMPPSVANTSSASRGVR